MMLESKRKVDQDVNTLNHIILEAIEKSQKVRCSKKTNTKRLIPQTQALMDERRMMQRDENKEHQT